MRDLRHNNDLFDFFGMTPLFNELTKQGPVRPEKLDLANPFGCLTAGVGRADVCETETEYTLEVELPGFKKENIKLEYVNDCVKIVAEREDVKKDYVRRERYFGKVERTLYLGDNVDSKAIKAKFEDGILVVTVPKTTPEEKQSTITIE